MLVKHAVQISINEIVCRALHTCSNAFPIHTRLMVMAEIFLQTIAEDVGQNWPSRKAQLLELPLPTVTHEW